MIITLFVRCIRLIMINGVLTLNHYIIIEHHASVEVIPLNKMLCSKQSRRRISITGASHTSQISRLKCQSLGMHSESGGVRT